MNQSQYIVIGLLLLALSLVNGQRVAPGVPPQQYQHVPVQQHHQPPPQHYQQPPVQYQQVDPQYLQQQQQVQYQQQPVVQHQQQPVVQHQQQPVVQHQQVVQQHHPQAAQAQHPQVAQQVPHGHGHEHPQHPQQVLNAANIQQERAHIQEHMEVPIDTSKMSEQELQFHYFKMHDSDNNNKLDGCELIKSLIHWHEQGSKEHHTEKPHVEEKVFSDEELVALIDPILQMDDTSRDGFIDYPEFIKAQQKAAAQKQSGH